MRVKKVEVGTEVVLNGDHHSEWADCADGDKCKHEIHREFATGKTTTETRFVAGPDGEVEETVEVPETVLRHKYGVRTGMQAVVIGEEPAPSVVVGEEWHDLDPEEVHDAETAAAYANKHNVPVQRRISDNVWVWGELTKITPPWAKPKLVLLVKPEGGQTTTVSADYADVELV